MIKKIILISIFLSLLVSCGKKGDPEYKAKNYNTLTSKV
jgi:hypothetical protein